MWEIPVLLLIYVLLNYFLPKKEVKGTTEHEYDGAHSSKSEMIGNSLAEEEKGRVKIKQTEKWSPEETKKGGKVPLWEYTVLQEHRHEMVNKLDPERNLSHLKENNVIDKDDVEKIEKKCKDSRRKGDEAETMSDVPDLFQKSHLATELRGRMSEVEFEVLIDNHERLVNELDSSVLKPRLFENGLIDEEDMTIITMSEEELRKKETEEIVNKLYESGAKAFPEMIKSLNDTGLGELSSQLKSSLEQKKKQGAQVGIEFDLNLVAFPNYPFGPQIWLETFYVIGAISNWRNKFIKWKQDGAGKLWCVYMNNWFKEHEFEIEEELKIVVEDWLLKLEEVINRGCLEIDEINIISNMVQILVMRRLNPNIQLEYLNKFVNIMPNGTITDDNVDDFVQTKKTEKQRLLEQQRAAFDKRKHNLEGIVAGRHSFDLLPIDTERCELAGFFHSVVDDVREIWNKFH